MQISVLGLGYVGAVAAACLADSGNNVVVVDINETKVLRLNEGQSPIMEPGLTELIERNVAQRRLSATPNLRRAVGGSEATIICVGTPSASSGDSQLADLDRVVEEVARTLHDSPSWHLVMLTSTVPPGTTEGRVIPLLQEISGKSCGPGSSVSRSRPSSSGRDPRSTTIGTQPRPSWELTTRGRSTAQALSSDPFVHSVTATSISVAEMVKLTDNSWHALKVAFTNEIGRFCSALGIDSHAVMNVFKSDTRLNISAAYMTPGYAFGALACRKTSVLSFIARASSGWRSR